MVRASLSLAGLALTLVACSGVKNYQLGLRGSTDLNPNSDNQPTPVQVRVLRLKGDEAAKTFDSAPFNDLWAKPAEVSGIALDGAVQSVTVPARDERVVVDLKDVPAEVTHFGLLALFKKAETGKERRLFIKHEVDDADVLLRGNVLGAAPAEPAAPPRQD